MLYLLVRTYWDGSVHAYEFKTQEGALKALNRDIVPDIVVSSALLQKEDADDVVWKPFEGEVQG